MTPSRGPFPGPLREVLGLEAEEFSPLWAGEQTRLMDPDGGELTGDVWTEFVVPSGDGLEYSDGLTDGLPAITRNTDGRGTAWYVSTRLDARSGARVRRRRCPDRSGGVYSLADLEVVRRRGESASYLFAIDHSENDAEVARTAPARSC